jgi:molybdopterin molybdotransferase
MITVSEADAIISASEFFAPSIKSLPLEECLGSILAEDIFPERDLPPFNRAMMDGFGIHLSDKNSSKTEFTIKQRQLAGDSPIISLGDDECAEIMTGSNSGECINCIIPVERMTIKENKAYINPDFNLEVGQYIHPRGSDTKKDRVLLSKGQCLDVNHMMALASSGKKEIKVFSPLRIKLIVTGDEIITNSENLSSESIRSTSEFAIRDAIKKYFKANIETIYLKDDKAQLQSLDIQSSNFDIYIFTGGVSMGKADLVQQMINENCEVLFHKIKQKPGLPLLLAKNSAGKFIFGLPGNPMSSLICTYRYVLKIIERIYNQDRILRSIKVNLSQSTLVPNNLTYFLPVKMIPDSNLKFVDPRPTNTSGDYISIIDTDGFIEINPEDDLTKKQFNFWYW